MEVDNMYYCFYKSPVGDIVLVGDDEGLRHLTFAEKIKIKSDWILNPMFFEEQRSQLLEYFLGKRTAFDFKINIQASDFQKQVYDELQKIPCGVTSSYEQIADNLGDKNKARAVATACAKNPLLLIIPCHRVIKKSCDIGDYSCGIERKCKLLDFEYWNYGQY